MLGPFEAIDAQLYRQKSQANSSARIPLALVMEKTTIRLATWERME